MKTRRSLPWAISPWKEWDSYVEELNRMGLDRYIELAQEAYDALQG